VHFHIVNDFFDLRLAINDRRFKMLVILSKI